MLKCRLERACEPYSLTSAMSATPLGFAVSAHYDANAIRTAYRYDCTERCIDRDEDDSLTTQIPD
jgi:hypothetical protein